MLAEQVFCMNGIIRDARAVEAAGHMTKTLLGGVSMTLNIPQKPENCISGIYVIVNLANGHRYIGSAINLGRRCREHYNKLRREKHPNAHLQKAWLKYEDESFSFSILETCDKAELVEREQFYISFYGPEYNICRTAGNTLGVTKSIETREKISAAKKGKKLSTEHCAKISITLIGNTYAKGLVRTPETRAQMSAAHVGLSPTKETRVKLSAAKTGNTNFLGKIHTPETRAQMSVSATGNTRCKGRVHGPETRAKIKATNIATAERKKQQKENEEQ